MKTQHTSKLFYNKFTHKISLNIPHIAATRYMKKQTIEALLNCETYEQWISTRKLTDKSHYMYIGVSDLQTNTERLVNREKKLWKNRFTIYKLISFINELSLENIAFTKRIEGNNISLFLNDQKYFDKACKIFATSIVGLVWPKNEVQGSYLLNNPTDEIVKQLPYKKYRFKANIKGWFNTGTNLKMTEWIQNYSEIKATDLTLKELDDGFTTNGKFIYVTDKKTMLLLEMYLGNILKDITTYKLESEIESNG